MKFQNVVRYEFRVFGPDLTRIKDALFSLGAPQPQPLSRETYIATRLNIEANVKIRASRLEVKVLRARAGVLEQWAPVLSTVFPVAAKDIEDIVAPALGIELDLEDTGALTQSAQLTLAEDQHSLATVVVEKNRTLVDLGDCEGEFSELQIGGEKLQTAAIEAIDAVAAVELLRRYHLDEAQNESYAAYLQRRLF